MNPPRVGFCLGILRAPVNCKHTFFSKMHQFLPLGNMEDVRKAVHLEILKVVVKKMVHHLNRLDKP